MNTEKLCIYNYLDYRLYLQDYYQLQKKSNPNFSYAVWAQNTAIKSRSFLRLLVMGKRTLTEKMLPAILQSLKLNADEKHFFVLLVRFNQADSIEAREEVFSAIKSCKKHQLSKIHDTYHYLSSHWCPRVHVLLTLEDIDRTCEALAKMTRLSVAEMEKILKTLEQLGIAEQNEDGQWQAQETVFQIPDDLNNLAIQSFHKNSLQMAQAAIESNPNERQYLGIFMPLTAQEYQELNEELDRVTTQLLARYSSSQGKNKKLYQLNTSLIPASTQLIHSTDKQSRDYMNESKSYEFGLESGVLQ